jgi:hypothetical protein
MWAIFHCFISLIVTYLIAALITAGKFCSIFFVIPTVLRYPRVGGVDNA